MFVIKRDGNQEPVHFDKITSRIAKLCSGLNTEYIDPVIVSQKVCLGVYNGVKTYELDELAAETAVHLITTHPDYGVLASRIAITNLHKNTLSSFYESCTLLYNYVNPKTDEKAPILSKEFYNFVKFYKERLDSAIQHERDFYYDYFGFKTLQKSYLLRCGTKIVERPQYMLMRQCCAFFMYDIEQVIKTYDMMSKHFYTHGTPTMFNAGTVKPGCSSCYLKYSIPDSIEEIYDSMKELAILSKNAGGVGLPISEVRSVGEYIKGTNGTTNGIVPMLRVMNATARYVDQGGNKRKGSFAVYLEPWHPEIMSFLLLKTNHGIEEERARDLSYGLWIPDLFMERVEKDLKWTLFDPNVAPGLTDVFGDKFNELYLGYEKDPKRVHSVVNARDVWKAILDSQQQTGMPYMLYKDAVNKKNNQSNLGTIKHSNLCVAGNTKILTYEGHIEIQTLVNKSVYVWNGMGWSKVTVVKTGTNQQLMRVTLTDNKYLDCTPYHIFYDRDSNEIRAADLLPGTKLERWIHPSKSFNAKIWPEVATVEYLDGSYDTFCFTEPLRNRGVFNGILTGQCAEVVIYSSPKEIGVCNIASVSLPMFVKEDGTFDFGLLGKVVMQVIQNLNRVIIINFYPLEQARYSNLKNRPIGVGVQGLAETFFKLRLPFDSPEAKKLNKDIFETIYYFALKQSMLLAKDYGPYESYMFSPAWEGQLQFDLWGVTPSNRWDWKELKAEINEHGLRNSLVCCVMPTASTSQILGNTESMEPISSNIYVRRTLAGEFVCFNSYLCKDLMSLNLWSPAMKNEIIKNNGSIQNIKEIPGDIKLLYRTVWEIPQKSIVDMSADRAPFVDQTQSLNIHMKDCNAAKLTSMHFYAWKKGLKTGMYYLRTKAATDATKFTVDVTKKAVKSEATKSTLDMIECSLDNPEACLSCSG